MKETTDDHRTDTVRTIASDAEERGGAIVRYVSVAEGRVARLDAEPSDVLGAGASYVAANAKTTLGGGLALATSTVKPGSMESAVARWTHQVDTFAAALVAKWAPNLATSWKSIASHRMTPVLAFGAMLALLTALALRLWQQRRWVSAMALGATVTLLAPGCDCTGKQGAGRNPRDASTLIAELPVDAVFYHGDWQGSPVATTDAAGKVTSRTAYLPYGAERSRKGLGDGASSAGAKSEPWSYVGNERDFGSGLSNFHARSYRPEIGRFLSVDPVALFQGEEVLKEPMRLEAYTYGSGDPMSRVDKDGRFAWLALVAGSALVGGGVEAFRQYSNGEQFSLSKVLVAGGSAAIGTTLGFVSGGAGAGALLAGAYGGAASSGLNRIGQDIIDGKGFRLEQVIKDASIGAVLGGALGWGAGKLIPVKARTVADLTRLQRVVFLSTRSPDRWRAAVAAGAADVVSVLAGGIVDALRSVPGKGTEERHRVRRDAMCDDLSPSCYVWR